MFPSGSTVRLDVQPADVERHAELVHDWMNRLHVAPWWQLDRPLPDVRAYLAGLSHLQPWVVSAGGVPFGYVETYRVPDDPLAGYYPAHDNDVGWHLLVGPEEYLGSGLPRLLGRAFVAMQLGLVAPVSADLVGDDGASGDTASTDPAGSASVGNCALTNDPTDGEPVGGSQSGDDAVGHAKSVGSTPGPDRRPCRGDRVVCEPDVRNTRMHAFCRRLGFRPFGEIELPDKRALLMVCTRENFTGALADNCAREAGSRQQHEARPVNDESRGSRGDGLHHDEGR